MLEIVRQWMIDVLRGVIVWLALYAELTQRIDQLAASVTVLDRDMDVMLARSAAYGVN